MENIMLELVKYIAESLVDKPEEVKVSQTEDERSVVIELSVAREDMGKVIGKQGRIAKAIRAVVKAASSKSRKKYVVEIAEHD
jgi:Predicted RNA-binding protein (contains KH domain)